MQTPFRNIVLASSLTVLLVLSGAAVADKASQNITEARQETQIWTAYALNPHLRANTLSVAVKNGKATLTGTVEENVSKDLALQIAKGVKGITSVDNQIVVQADYVPERSADRNFGDLVDDATITSTVKSKLLWSRYTDGLSTDVDTQRGKVTLTGTADTAAAKELAGRLATNTRGVVSVDNQLMIQARSKDRMGNSDAAVENNTSAAREGEREVADAWITTKVKSTLLYSAHVDGTDINVNTQKGVVTLSGKVDSGAERSLAIELAKNVHGVKSVQAKSLTM